MRANTNPMLTRNLLILDSRETILSLAPLLELLAARCGQKGALHWLTYFLDPAVLGTRVPRLVLLLGSESDSDRGLTVDDLQAAALFFEYELFGIRTGIVATGDAVGFNTIVAPERLRPQVAAVAARALLDRGASLLLATYDPGASPEAHRWQLAVATASRQRQVPRMLHLHPTLDATLAKMGKSTRFNLRYYRRRLERQQPCDFVEDAAPLLRDEDLQRMNAESLNPVPEAEFRRRVACASDLNGSFLCGLRDADGRWLSLVGGWRQGDTTVLYWQLNRNGMEKHSIGTVMRSYFLEAEIARGARSLLIYGGTPHTMRNAFTEDTITDLVMTRRGLRSAALKLAARLMLHTRLKGRGNFVLETLCSPELHWHTEPTAKLLPASAPRLQVSRPRRVA